VQDGVIRRLARTDPHAEPLVGSAIVMKNATFHKSQVATNHRSDRRGWFHAALSPPTALISISSRSSGLTSNDGGALPFGSASTISSNNANIARKIYGRHFGSGRGTVQSFSWAQRYASIANALQVPITPPSFFRTMTVAERGRPAFAPSGHFEKRVGCAGSLRSLGVSPGC
jgi:hypothetical protein